MDSIDVKIATLLGEDGRLTFRDIARRIGVSEGTIRKRLSRLLSKGKLRIVAQASSEAFPENYLAIVGLQLDGRRLTESAAEINQLPGVQSTMIVTGRYDLLVNVMLSSRQSLVDFVTGHLSRIPGVRQSETFLVLRSYGHWMPVENLVLTDKENTK